MDRETEYIKTHLEQDWDDDNLYFEVLENGIIRKYDVENNLTFEYRIDRVTH